MARLTGKVLWIDKHDGNGVIRAKQGALYFDESTTKEFYNLKPGDIVSFVINYEIVDALCARSVRKEMGEL